MPPAGKAGGSDFALSERVAYLNDADKPVPEQGLGAHLRTRLLPHNAGFEIDRALPNVRLALDTVPDAAREVEAFCRTFGIIPTNTPPRYAGPAGDAPGAERD